MFAVQMLFLVQSKKSATIFFLESREWVKKFLEASSKDYFGKSLSYICDPQPECRGSLGCRELVPGVPPNNTMPLSLNLFHHLVVPLNNLVRVLRTKKGLGNTITHDVFQSKKSLTCNFIWDPDVEILAYI